MQHSASWRQIVGVAKFSNLGATFIMAVAMATSYMTQVVLLLAHAVGWASWAVPLTIDVLALMSNLAIGLPRREGFGRKGLWFILIVTLSVSMVLNFMAGANFLASTAHVWVVAAYLAAEYVRGWVKRYRAALEDESEQTTTTAISAELVADVEAAFPVADAPVSPAVSAAIPTAPKAARKPSKDRKAYGPRGGDQYSERHDRRLRNGR